MLTESCVMFFFAVPCCCKHYIARWIFWPWRLELKKETRQAAISLWRQLELTPNYLISYLKNTGSRSTRYVSMPHPNESSILPKFLEKSDPEVARPAFSTWPVQKSQPKAFEVCASIQIHQSAYRDRWQFKTTTLPRTGMFVWSRYADWWIWIDAHTSNAFGWVLCTGHVEKAGLSTSGSLFSRNFGRTELSFGWGMDTYLLDREPVFSR